MSNRKQTLSQTHLQSLMKYPKETKSILIPKYQALLEWFTSAAATKLIFILNFEGQQLTW